MSQPAARAVQRTRKHHAIEHAATAVLFEQHGQRGGVAALSDPWGFTILSTFTEPEVQSAVNSALARLQSGRTDLAITDLCGSNLVVTGALSTLAVLAAGRGKWRNLPVAISAAALASVAAKPLGRWVQRTLTTETKGLDRLSVTAVGGRPVGGPRQLVRVTISED